MLRESIKSIFLVEKGFLIKANIQKANSFSTFFTSVLLNLVPLSFNYEKMSVQVVEGFSKLSKNEKIEWLAKTYFQDPKNAIKVIKQYWNKDADLQRLHDEFSENTISNYVSQVKCFLEYFNSVATKPSEISEKQIKEWLLKA